MPFLSSPSELLRICECCSALSAPVQYRITAESFEPCRGEASCASKAQLVLGWRAIVHHDLLRYVWYIYIIVIAEIQSPYVWTMCGYIGLLVELFVDGYVRGVCVDKKTWAGERKMCYTFFETHVSY